MTANGGVKTVQRQLIYAARASRLAVSDPRGAVARARGALDKRHDRNAWASLDVSPAELYSADAAWQPRLHDVLEYAAPCDTKEFDGLWSDMASSLGARGQGSARDDPELERIAMQFDAVPAFARALWCAARHLRPARILETGVARGITSRVLLEALERNGEGRLWSIDLPHPDNTQLGVAVPASLRDRWELLLGPSNVLLPKLLDDVSEVDLFVHDSLHTGRNVEFELTAAWEHLTPGGVVFADDIHQSLGFRKFLDRVGADCWIAAPRYDGGLWGMARKRCRRPEPN